MSTSTQHTQHDVSSVTIPVTQEMIDRVHDKHGEDLEIPYGDDPNKAEDPDNLSYALGGYLAEEAVAIFCEKKGVVYEHQGEEGTIDFLIDGRMKVEVKSRQSKTAYRNMLVNEYIGDGALDYTEIDQYFGTVVHFGLNGEPVAVELLGVANREDVVDDVENIELHGGQDQHLKFEYPTHQLISPNDWAYTATL